MSRRPTMLPAPPPDLPRCPACLLRHPAGAWCPPAGEGGYLTRSRLVWAWTLKHGVCLWCQGIFVLATAAERAAGCPECGRPWERFGDDDLGDDRG
jgi:hypothetical protein